MAVIMCEYICLCVRVCAFVFFPSKHCQRLISRGKTKIVSRHIMLILFFFFFFFFYYDCFFFFFFFFFDVGMWCIKLSRVTFSEIVINLLMVNACMLSGIEISCTKSKNNSLGTAIQIRLV